jgi:hypothetical protein
VDLPEGGFNGEGTRRQTLYERAGDFGRPSSGEPRRIFIKREPTGEAVRFYVSGFVAVNDASVTSVMLMASMRASEHVSRTAVPQLVLDLRAERRQMQGQQIPGGGRI